MKNYKPAPPKQNRRRKPRGDVLLKALILVIPAAGVPTGAIDRHP
ncbi:hypothetical protein [Foetidibacter luteolus]|nr:hypothetical protein [Foetidibacter luteolus]